MAFPAPEILLSLPRAAASQITEVRTAGFGCGFNITFVNPGEAEDPEKGIIYDAMQRVCLCCLEALF